MIKTQKFLVSRPLYAVDLDSFQAVDGTCSVNAVWFRRRRRGYSLPLETVACCGRLWNVLQVPPPTVAEFLAGHTDNRYGGDCVARWDGTNLWSNADEAQRAEYAAVLRPMLAAYPEIPDGFDGWWGFE